MNLALQAKLIKVIEERTFRRIGGTKEIKVDIRIIAATNRDLKDLVSKNLFREDLYHRLNVIGFEMPPLRERKDDIPVLTDYFVAYFNSDLHRNVNVIPEKVREAFQNYHWPGNIRELRSTIERAVILSEGEELNPKYIQLEEDDGDGIKVEKSQDKIVLEIPLEEASLPKIEERVIREALNLNNLNQTKNRRDAGNNEGSLKIQNEKDGIPLK
jgi:Response regulator containing CheY-like receiver, AAA-type ATPase, and DNA-binding domains